MFSFLPANIEGAAAAGAAVFFLLILVAAYFLVRKIVFKLGDKMDKKNGPTFPDEEDEEKKGPRR